MRKSFFLIFLFAVANMEAQHNWTDILSTIELNNPQLKAGAQIVLSQKAEVSSQNTLEDPNFEFAHLWGTENSSDRKYDISVSQSFDFPSLYFQRNQIGDLKRSLYDEQQASLRQQILLQAKELCLRIVYLNRCIALGDERPAGRGRQAGRIVPGKTRFGRCQYFRCEQNRNRAVECHNQ